MGRKSIYKPNHILSTKSGTIRLARYILYEKLNGENARCHWCGLDLLWMTGKGQRKKENGLCADHVDGNIKNDKLENLVPSCRECNANRGTYGRRKKIKCKQCEGLFLPIKRMAIFCSNMCSGKSKIGKKWGTKTKHGTRSRYNYGCRCNLCRAENTKQWCLWRQAANVGRKNFNA